jgi:hypothetical protein
VCRWVCSSRRFDGSYFIQFQDGAEEDEGATVVGNVGHHTPNDTAAHLRRFESSELIVLHRIGLNMSDYFSHK